MKTPSLSITLITLNEARNITRCLESFATIATQVVVVDGGSVDTTLDQIQSFQNEYPHINVQCIAQKHWQGFGYQKNFALSHATGDWVFSVDADEWASPELIAELKQHINSGIHTNAYQVQRINYFCGKKIHYAWRRDWVARFFPRALGLQFSHDVVHEKLLLNHPRKLQHKLYHHPYQNYEDVLRKIQHYSSLGAKNIAGQAHFGRALAHGVWAFFRTYALSLGLLDGVAGFNIALMNALASYFKYMK